MVTTPGRRSESTRIVISISPCALKTRTVAPSAIPRLAASSGFTRTTGSGPSNSANIVLIVFGDAGDSNASGNGSSSGL